MDGTFWLGWIECWISTLKPNKSGGTGNGASGHPRLRIVVPKGLRRSTKAYELMSRTVSPARLEEFRHLENPSKQNVTQVRFNIHHIGWNSGRSSSSYTPLRVGSGTYNISHFCDQTGCVRFAHLAQVRTQGENNALQRCLGMILVVRDDNLIAFQPCRHAIVRIPGIIDTEVLRTCCRKIQIVCIGGIWPELGESLW